MPSSLLSENKNKDINRITICIATKSFPKSAQNFYIFLLTKSDFWIYYKYELGARLEAHCISPSSRGGESRIEKNMRGGEYDGEECNSIIGSYGIGCFRFSLFLDNRD